MAVNAANARIYGSDADAIYLAPIGTALPLDIDTPLSPAFEDVGWLNEDGITESATGSRSEIRGHQGGNVVRTRVEGGGTTIAFVALEDKPQTRSLRYNVKESTVTPGGARRESRGAGQRITARTAVIEMFDADDVTVRERICIERLEVMPDGDRAFVNSDIAGFSLTGQVIGDYYTLTSGPAELVDGE